MADAAYRLIQDLRRRIDLEIAGSHAKPGWTLARRGRAIGGNVEAHDLLFGES